MASKRWSSWNQPPPCVCVIASGGVAPIAPMPTDTWKGWLLCLAFTAYGGVVTLPQRRPQDHVVGAASTTVLGMIAGPRREATVLHAGPEAAYLRLDGTCVGVLAAGAVLVPCGVRTALPRLPALSAGDKAVVQDSSIEVPGLEITVTEIVDTNVPVLAPAAAGRGAHELREAVGDRLAGVLAELPAEPLRQLAASDPAAVAGLMGLGIGLTPLGDDVLAGWLATGVATQHVALGPIRSAVALSAQQRTTTLSATLLAYAARGECVPAFRSLLGGMATGDPGPVEQSLEDVLVIGDTSGLGLVLGALTALQSLSPSLEGATR